MRLTQATLKEFLKADKIIKQLEQRRQEIRSAIIAEKKTKIEIGEFLVTVKDFVREVPKHTQTGKRVQVKQRGNLLKIAAAVFVAISCLATSGCSSVPRTKWTDKTMRIIIDPDGIDANNYVRIQQALVNSGKWVVLDRASAFYAIKKEQERLHRTEADRFEKREKWAIWGRALGAGGIVEAHVQCQNKHHWLTESQYARCQQFISIADSNTTEILAAVENTENGDLNEYNLAPSWNDVVAMMNDAYPNNFKPKKDSEILENYRDLAAEESTRQEESLIHKDRPIVKDIATGKKE